MNPSILLVLLRKDLCRAWRNPVPYLIHLCLPLVITGMLGMVLGGARSGGALIGTIRVAVVDEDDTAITRLLRGALGQGGSAGRIEPRFLSRGDALREVTNGTVAAAILLPRGSTERFLGGEGQVAVELVKNPAQQIHPALVEEALGAVITGLNALGRNFRSDLTEWRTLVSGGQRPGAVAIGLQVERTAARFEVIRRRLDPLPVGYEIEEEPAAAGIASGPGGGRGHGGGRGQPGFNLFAFLLPGLAAMFLLFLADVAMRDLQREVRERTFERFCTLPQNPFVFVLGKVAFVTCVVVLGAGILLGLGPVLFRFSWEQPVAVACLTLGYCGFAAGLMAALVGVVGGGRRAELLGTLVAMALGLAGGGAFPADSLPTFLREHVTAHLPTAWFIEAVRATQGTQGALDLALAWPRTAVELGGLGVALTVVAAVLLRRRLAGGQRAVG